MSSHGPREGGAAPSRLHGGRRDGTAAADSAAQPGLLSRRAAAPAGTGHSGASGVAAPPAARRPATLASLRALVEEFAEVVHRPPPAHADHVRAADVAGEAAALATQLARAAAPASPPPPPVHLRLGSPKPIFLPAARRR